MKLVTCPRTGHVRKFANGRAAKRWLAEQAGKYVPTLEEDVNAFSGISVQKNELGQMVKARVPGAGYAGGDKIAKRKEGVKVPGKSAPFKERAKGVDPDGKSGVVSHESKAHSRLVTKDGEKRKIFLPSKPVLSPVRRDVSADLHLTKYQQIAKDQVNYGLQRPVRDYMVK
jgi:hypothetical protein